MRQVQIEILFRNGEIREIRQDYKKMNLLDFSAIPRENLLKNGFPRQKVTMRSGTDWKKRSLWMTPMPAMRTSFMVRKRRNWNLTNA